MYIKLSMDVIVDDDLSTKKKQELIDELSEYAGRIIENNFLKPEMLGITTHVKAHEYNPDLVKPKCIMNTKENHHQNNYSTKRSNEANANHGYDRTRRSCNKSTSR